MSAPGRPKKESAEQGLPRPDAQTDPVSEFSAYSKRELRLLLRVLAQALPWGRLLVQYGKTGLRETDLHSCAAIAANNLFGGWGVDELGEIAGLQGSYHRFLDHPATVEIQGLLEEFAEVLGTADKLERWIEVTEAVVARETLHTGLYASDPRTRMAALSAFTDRTLPKKGRDEERTLQIRFPPKFLEAIEGAARIMEQRGLLDESGVIDAEVVPLAYLPEGEEEAN